MFPQVSMMFKAGDVVKVIKTGLTYASYTEVADIFKIELVDRKLPITSDVYKVIGSKNHRDNTVIIVAITNGEDSFLVQEAGLSLVTKAVPANFSTYLLDKMGVNNHV